ncbi:hypothetical protein B0O80DRAFT_172978 [Mortierella sp. GBAus27b]|nr:hypothetical protein B0O80DRAFT_172978 [Mortierella sp. GBAus27b]
MKKTVIATSSKGAVVNKRASREEVVTNKPFDAEGIDTLVDWITDAGNYESSTNRRSIFGQKKLVHSHRDIASYINSIHGTEWSQQTVANRLIWLKKVYDRAKKISTSASKGRNTETDTTLREKVLTVCPPFKRLHTVFEIPVAGLQLPPVQTLSLQPEEPANSKTLLSPRDMADQDGIDDKDYDDHFTEDETASHSRQRSKRREMEKTAITTTSKSAVNKRASKENDAIKRSFNADGIGTLVDWITDAEHYMPTVDHQSIFRRRRLIHSHCDIASYINSIHGTKWDWHTVSNRLLWLKGAYYRARKILTSAGEGEDIETDTTLRDKVLTICPPFERLDAVFGEPLESLHLPPVQTLPPQPEEPVNSRALLLPHDMVDHDDIDDKYYDDHLTEDEAESHSSRAIKRQKTEKTAVVTPQDHIGQIIQASDRPHIPMDDAIGDIRRRQDVLEAGQKDITDRLLETERKHHEMLTKREEQHMDMLMQMEEQHRERLKKRERRHRKSLKRREKEHKAHHHRQWKRQLRELEDEKAELREEKAELKEVKEELKQKKAQFKKERDGMLQNMAAMMRELDLKTTCSHRH